MAAGERGKAIEEAVAGFQRGQAELRRATGVSRGILGEQRGQIRTDIGAQRELFDPFIQAGTGALQDVQRGATVGGLDERLAQILGTGAFQGLREERTRDIRGQLAAGGLTRSGAGLEEIAGISPELAFQIESQLFGRSRDIAGLGFEGAGQAGQLALGQAGFETRLSGLEAQIANQLGINLAGGEVGIGQVQSQGRLAAFQEQQRKSSFLNKFIGNIAGVGADILLPGSGAFVRGGVTGGLEAF